MYMLNRCQESFTTTGTGTLTLGGAPTGWRTYAAALLADWSLSGTVTKVLYYAVNSAEDTWEFGYGTVDTVAGTITRNLIASSTGSLISWAAGTKYIFSTPEAILTSQHLTTFRSATAPVHARSGYKWLDTTNGVTDVRFKIYDGTDWIAVCSIDETNNRCYVFDASGAKMGSAEVDVASAGTCDIGAATSDNVRITGTTGITGLGTVVAGTRRYVRFAGALTLTHNATSLILPGAANITTAAGDRMLAKSLGSGNWEIVAFIKASGAPVLSTSGILDLIGSTRGSVLYRGASGWAALTPGTSGHFLKSNGAGADPSYAQATQSVAILRDEKADGTHGGGYTAGAWQNCDLNTEHSDPDAIVAIADPNFTPIAGTYLISVTRPRVGTGNGRLRLWNNTAAAQVAIGLNSGDVSSSARQPAELTAVFAANGTDTYKVQLQASVTRTTDGMGEHDAMTLGVEVYMSVYLVKIA